MGSLGVALLCPWILLGACSGSEMRPDAEANKKNRTTKETGDKPSALESADSGEAAQPEVIAGAYLDTNITMSIENQAVVSVKLLRQGKRILAEVLEQRGAVVWQLLVNGLPYQEEEKGASLAEQANEAGDKVWEVDLNRYGAEADLKAVAFITFPGKPTVTIKEGRPEDTEFAHFGEK